MPRPTPADLAAAAGRTIPDILPDPLRLLVVGINPSLWSGATGAHFARPGNRFWPALHAAGITDHVIDCTAGMRPDDRAALEILGLGITNLVDRATARADELTADEIRAGAARLERTVAARHPRVVAVVGIAAYRTGFRRPKARAGRQPEDLAGAELWVLPNPSGLNAHETVASLAAAYGAAADAAGIRRRISG
ncbi:mismatch-specific DNA-glycosylase [Raineyella sp. LH-20]|uniref:mismatch-specific DNA-glycosylase n=1 Tax=Raineyella sp. LH-20 TaxID=3081204 RepID=UPI0029534BF0|nr:mismatch-specific DNA-glycosylase [Raineyella sp. LH-20]WOP19180.1 mismatch-specific DNA-glycosylase [Raineyella sp. LH-20]